MKCCLNANNKNEEKMNIYCVQCKKTVEAYCVSGQDIYPYRPDLYRKLFYKCPHCGNWVGTHKDGRPLGTIPYAKLRKLRHMVHEIIDSHWLPTKSIKKRRELYKSLSNYIGKEYHTAELNTEDECIAIITYYKNNFSEHESKVTS